MRVPEDYIMGTTGEKSKGIGCFFFLLLFIIGMIVVACAVNFSASDTILGGWLADIWADIKMTVIVILSIVGFIILMLILTRFGRKE